MRTRREGTVRFTLIDDAMGEINDAAPNKLRWALSDRTWTFWRDFETRLTGSVNYPRFLREDIE